MNTDIVVYRDNKFAIVLGVENPPQAVSKPRERFPWLPFKWYVKVLEAKAGSGVSLKRSSYHSNVRYADSIRLSRAKFLELHKQIKNTYPSFDTNVQRFVSPNKYLPRFPFGGLTYFWVPYHSGREGETYYLYVDRSRNKEVTDHGVWQKEFPQHLFEWLVLTEEKILEVNKRCNDFWSSPEAYEGGKQKQPNLCLSVWSNGADAIYLKASLNDSSDKAIGCQQPYYLSRWELEPADWTSVQDKAGTRYLNWYFQLQRPVMLANLQAASFWGY